MTCTPFTGRGAGGPSIDQVIAAKIGGESRFRSLQIGVSQESFGESIQRNMSWAGYDRAAAAGDDPAQAVRPAVRRSAKKAGSTASAASSMPCARMPTLLKKKLPNDDQAARRRAPLRRFATWSAPSPACRPSTGASIRRTTTAT